MSFAVAAPIEHLWVGLGGETWMGMGVRNGILILSFCAVWTAWVGRAYADSSAQSQPAGTLTSQPTSSPSSQPAPPASTAAIAATRPAGPLAGRTDSPPLLTLKGDQGGKSLWQMLAYTLILLVLGGVAFFVVRRFLPRIGLTAGKNVSVQETVYLGPKRSVHLIRVGSRQYLVAQTREQISMLADVTGATGEATPKTLPDARFQQTLDETQAGHESGDADSEKS